MSSMIEVMEDSKRQFVMKSEEANYDDGGLIADDVGLKLNHENSSSDELTQTAPVLMMRMDSTTGYHDFLEVVEQVAMSSVAGEAIVVKESMNSVIIPLGPNSSPSGASRLVTFAIHVIRMVRLRYYSTKFEFSLSFVKI